MPSCQGLKLPKAKDKATNKAKAEAKALARTEAKAKAIKKIITFMQLNYAIVVCKYLFGHQLIASIQANI